LIFKSPTYQHSDCALWRDFGSSAPAGMASIVELEALADAKNNERESAEFYKDQVTLATETLPL
jgi:hypothetical protein